jgi:hypothetical protein
MGYPNLTGIRGPRAAKGKFNFEPLIVPIVQPIRNVIALAYIYAIKWSF